MMPQRSSILPKRSRLSSRPAFAALVGAILLASLAPLALFDFDHWDGVIYHYAILRDEFAGVHQMHQQVGAHILNAGYILLDRVEPRLGRAIFLMLPYTSLLVFSLGLLSLIRLFSGRAGTSWTSVVIAASSPVAALSSSSMLSPLFLLLGLGFLGATLAASERWWHRWLGWGLVFSSLAVLHASLAIVWIAIMARLTRILLSERDRSGIHWRIGEPFLFGGGAILVMALVLMLNPAHGLYVGYAEPSLAATSIESLVKNTLRLFLPSAIGLGFLLWLSSRGLFSPKVDVWSELGVRNSFLFLGVPVLCILNAIPFVLTARGVPDPTRLFFVGAGAEDYRYLLVSFAVGQLVAAVALELSRPHFRLPFVKMVAFVMIFAFPLANLALWASYVRLDAKKLEIVELWKSASWSDNLACSMEDRDMAPGAGGYSWRYYDLNYLSYLARGRADRFVCAGECSASQQLELVQMLCTGSDRAPEIYIFDDSSCKELIGELQTRSVLDERMPRCLR